MTRQCQQNQPVYCVPSDVVVAALESDSRNGLATSEALARLQRYGNNALPDKRSIPVWRKLLTQFWNPLTILLLVAVMISFVVWWAGQDHAFPYEPLTILGIVVFNGILGYVQEHRAEQAVAALQAISAATARVLRDGYQQAIPTVEVVPGDILIIEEGDTIAADARVLETVVLYLAESVLTGESAPVVKSSILLEQEVGIADQYNMVFSGTTTVAGRGKAIVTATGVQTELGHIASSLQQNDEKETPLQRELDQVGKWLGIGVILIAVVMGATILLVDHASTLSEIVNILLLVVSLAVAAVPEGVTAITTIVLSLGMQRMARRHVIVRKLSAVETLGSTTVICTDKTGTLTKNEMTVRAVVTASGRVDFTGAGYDPQGSVLQAGQPLTDPVLFDEVETVLCAAILVNNATLGSPNGVWTIQGDPTEGALLVAARKVGLSEQGLEARFPRKAEIPFSSERKLMSTLHEDRTRSERMLIFSKGAPDILLARCVYEQAGVDGTVLPLTSMRRTNILADVAHLGDEALRTIGVASSTVSYEEIEEPEQFNEREERNLTWLGFIGMIDPPRLEAAEAVQLARQAGIRVIMITGDHPSTAAAIACELGISEQSKRAVTGAELKNVPDEVLREMVHEASVYARVAPEQKLRIVQALKANGEIVTMTGDGVNDAPALKMADIGIAMGIAGTDVAKDVADMILTDDNFASIVAAVEEGRSIFANIQKFLRYLLSSNFGEVLTMFFGIILASVIGLVGEAGTSIIVPLLSTQILWINLLTDAAPALALGIDPREPQQMHRPPRSQTHRVISPAMWASIGLVGIIMAAQILFVIDWSLPGGLIPGNGTLRYAQTMAFTTLVLAQLFNVFNARSDKMSAFRSALMNRWVWLAVLLSLLLQGVVVYLPPLESAFSSVPLRISDWLFCLVVASTVLWGRELAKLVEYVLKR